MANPATAGNLPALTVALTLLRDGYTELTITVRTGVDLYRLAEQHGVTARCGTIEGHRCHEARGGDPCLLCETAHTYIKRRTHGTAAPLPRRGARTRRRTAVTR